MHAAASHRRAMSDDGHPDDGALVPYESEKGDAGVEESKGGGELHLLRLGCVSVCLSVCVLGFACPFWAVRSGEFTVLSTGHVHSVAASTRLQSSRPLAVVVLSAVCWCQLRTCRCFWGQRRTSACPCPCHCTVCTQESSSPFSSFPPPLSLHNPISLSVSCAHTHAHTHTHTRLHPFGACTSRSSASHR